MTDTSEDKVQFGQILEEISIQTEVRQILYIIRDACFALGVRRMSYHLTRKMHSQTDQSIHLVAVGFPKQWVDLYEKPEFREHDPIPDIIMQHGEPMLWQDALSARKLTEKEKNFVEQLEAYGLWDGIGIPLFGQNVRNAYSAFQFENRKCYLKSKE